MKMYYLFILLIVLKATVIHFTECRANDFVGNFHLKN